MVVDKVKQRDLDRSLAAASGGLRSSGASAPGGTNVAAMIAPASHPRVAKEVVVGDVFGEKVAFRMSFLGVGQGGGRLAQAFWDLGYRRAAALNTTQMDFDGLCDEMHKLDLGVGGAAKDAEFARAQLEGREEEVWDLFTRAWGVTTECGLICACLGGGTGSGLAAPVVEIARRYMSGKGQTPRVGAVIALPTGSEGQLVARNAINAFHRLLEMRVSPLVIIDNARINALYRPSMSKLHGTANNTVSLLFHQFNRLCEVPDSIHVFDRSEFAQLLDGGIVVMGAASLQDIRTPADISTAIREQLANNVLAEVDLRRGRRGACLFVASQAVLDEFPEEYFAAGYEQLVRTLGTGYGGGAEAVVHRGLSVSGDEGVQVYMMISELEPPMRRLEELSRLAGMGRESLRSRMAAFLGVDDA